MTNSGRINACIVSFMVVVICLGVFAPQADATEKMKEITVDLGDGVKMVLVVLPAGEFLMGQPGGIFDEVPAHKVTISKPFCIGKYEVTQEQWQTVMGTNPSRFKKPTSPVERVSWTDAKAFADKLNEKFSASGVKFALPTEAQWEYACRAGTTTRWNFGDDKSVADDYAWWDKNSGYTTNLVGQKKPNAWGLYDMHGNVWEWCADWYGDDYYKNSPPKDPIGPSKGLSRVLRGGCFRYENPKNFRSAFRYMDFPDRTNDHHGFRIAGSLAP